MPQTQFRLVSLPDAAAADPLWDRIRRDAADLASREPELEAFLQAAVLGQDSLEIAIFGRIAERLGTGAVPASTCPARRPDGSPTGPGSGTTTAR